MTRPTMIDSLYKEEILEHYKSPLNFGKLNLYDVSSKQLNPFCGDEIEMFIIFKQQSTNYSSIRQLAERSSRLSASNNKILRKSYERKKIEDVSFFGKGCAISIASASLLTEYIKGKSKKTMQKFSEKDMIKLLNIEISETRKKCALLAWSVLQDCIL